MITPDDERRYGLRPLPDVPFPSHEEVVRRHDAWPARLAAQRAADGLPSVGIGLDRRGRPTR
jgi:hypothetical protein